MFLNHAPTVKRNVIEAKPRPDRTVTLFFQLHSAYSVSYSRMNRLQVNENRAKRVDTIKNVTKARIFLTPTQLLRAVQ